MPRSVRLPRPDPRSSNGNLPWRHSLVPPPEAIPRRRVHHLAVGEVAPQVHICHRLVGEVGVSYRVIFDHELIAVLVGEGDLYLDGVRHGVAAPCLVAIPPWVPHALLTRTGRRGDQIAIHHDLAPGVPDRPRAGRPRGAYAVAVDGAPPLPPVQPLEEPVLAGMVAVLEAWRAADDLAPLRATRALQGVLLRLWSDAAPVAEGVGADPGIADALAVIAERYAEPLRVADLARAAGLGRSRFAQRFQAWTGRSPGSFLRRYRIDRCCELLLADEVTLNELASRVGYGDAFALSKAFRAELGISPTAWLAEQLSAVRGE